MKFPRISGKEAVKALKKLALRFSIKKEAMFTYINETKIRDETVLQFRFMEKEF